MSLDSATSETSLDSAADLEVVQYRAVCGVSIMAFLLGLASASAFIAPLLWFVPVVAALVALLALARIRARPAELTGQGLALAALGLAVLFGTWAPTQSFARQLVLFRQADTFGQEWFELLRNGKRYEAFELHLAPRNRQAANVSLARFYEASTDARESLKKFFDSSPQKELAEAGSKANITLRHYVAVAPDEESDTAQVIILDYEARWPGGAGESVAPVRLFLRRHRPEANGLAQWDVLSLIDPRVPSR